MALAAYVLLLFMLFSVWVKSGKWRFVLNLTFSVFVRHPSIALLHMISIIMFFCAISYWYGVHRPTGNSPPYIISRLKKKKEYLFKSSFSSFQFGQIFYDRTPWVLLRFSSKLFLWLTIKRNSRALSPHRLQPWLYVERIPRYITNY